ncbi:MAG: hypothetical protein ACRDOI_25135 [Trebonia sp.]
MYPSEGIGAALGLSSLWIAFKGYWPERGALLETVTFKEYEALTVLGRVTGDDGILTVASSGNTGAAFAWARLTRRSLAQQDAVRRIAERALSGIA